MIPNLDDFLDLLEELAPARLAEPWDNPGLQVAVNVSELRKVFLALDPTAAALQRAAQRKAQILLTHHPLIFRPLSRVDVRTYPGDVIAEAIGNEIALLALHTNLDAAPGGINDILAGLLGLENVDVLQPLENAAGAGLGRIGDLPAAMPLEAFRRSAAESLGIESLALIGVKPTGEVRRVAVVGGSGGSLAATAREKGADVLLTGDIGHHHALEAAERGLILVDGGHFGTEKAAFRIFGSKLREAAAERDWDVSIEVDEGEIDPMSSF